jgi:NAD(P)-dependent dehydrogenase (short-subunit alcohol dehydrogenase family)
VLEEYSLEGKVAIVTGAARGIGKGITLTLAEAGADIVAVDRTTDENEQTSSEVQALGRQCLAVTTDVTKEDQVQRMADAAISKFGKIDILVNNAGKGARRVVVPLAENNIRPITDEDWYNVLDLNLRAILLCARAVGPHMIEQRKGKIIIITSATAISAFDHNSLYCVSKAAAARFTQTLALEWAPYGINVNAIGPTWTLTEGAKMMLEKNEEYRQKEMARIPVGRAATPREIGLLVVYLASNASDFVTGQNIYIDGGLTAAG